MLFALKMLTLILVAVPAALSLAHALELPGKMRLTREHYLAVQPIYYPGFTYAGVCEPLSIIALAVLLGFTPGGTAEFWLIAGALAGAVLVNGLYWLLTAPVNKVWMQDEKLSGGARKFFGSDTGAQQDWKTLRNRWERSHVYRALAAATSFLLLSLAIMD
jgi:hypothetical protein